MKKSFISGILISAVMYGAIPVAAESIDVLFNKIKVVSMVSQ